MTLFLEAMTLRILPHRSIKKNDTKYGILFVTTIMSCTLLQTTVTQAPKGRVCYIIQMDSNYHGKTVSCYVQCSKDTKNYMQEIEVPDWIWPRIFRYTSYQNTARFWTDDVELYSLIPDKKKKNVAYRTPAFYQNRRCFLEEGRIIDQWRSETPAQYTYGVSLSTSLAARDIANKREAAGLLVDDPDEYVTSVAELNFQLVVK